MKKLLLLKAATILAFLLIVFPGKLAIFNGLSILLGFIVTINELFYPEGNFIKALPSLMYVITMILSIIFLFKNNKYINLICIIIQYASIIYMSKIRFLTYWYHTLPTSIYFILSLTVMYVLFVKRYPEKVIDS
jgi:hypothetical protein